MGKLRTFLSRFIKFKPEQGQNLPSPVCTHKHLPEKQQHTKLIANAVDRCIEHGQNMCLVCSDVHVRQHCHLDLKVNKQLGVGNLKEFNLGHMMKISLKALRCTCGKPLGNDPDHAICAACGMASCSEKCHDQWQARGNCTYHQNYYQKPKNINMRSILMSNIRNVQNAKISEWNLACKNALSYIACYAKANSQYVFLQRGYRNYGIPQQQLVENMTKMEAGLDYITHIQRVCDCKCEECVRRGWHSVGNCQYDCHQMADFHAFKYVDQSDMYTECSCNCQFCSSGVVVTRHTRYECALHCHLSDYKISKLI